MFFSSSRNVLPRPPRAGFFRQVVESFVLLGIAVVLFRSFGAEGYLISTGSMAPTLLGYHKRVTCPHCQTLFAKGAAFDSELVTIDLAFANFRESALPSSSARCPHCGVSGISTEDLPLNEGDQLLVQKHAFEFRDPRRWEVIVFRNPADPRQAYVKRVAGLPNERIEIVHGEVYANGELCRKPYAVQQSLRIPVSDFAQEIPIEDPDWESRWRPVKTSSEWQLIDGKLTIQQSGANESNLTDWLEYRQWVTQGGTHQTAIPLTEWPNSIVPPDGSSASALRYQNGVLSCLGALPDMELQRWLPRSEQKAYRDAFNKLFRASHEVPVTDEYGYNEPGDSQSYPLNDFLISLQLSRIEGNGRFEIQLTDGADVFRVKIDFASSEVELLLNDDPVPVRRTALSAEAIEKPLAIDFSFFDRQAIVAVNNQPLFTPYALPALVDRPLVSRPARLGAAQLNCVVENLALYRDVYYVSQVAESTPQKTMAEDEFYVLGDNSPVSVDSRVWSDPAVPRHSLIGKPLVVHLPSRQGQVEWKGETRYFRIPDFSRVRLVR